MKTLIMKNNADGNVAPNIALNYALKVLSRRNITTSGLQKKMIEKGFSEKEIFKTINKLLEWKYLDDFSYAAAYVKDKKEKFSRKKILYKLLNDGVNREVIDHVLDRYYSEDEEYRVCLEYAKKMWDIESVKWEKKYQNNPKYKNIPQLIFIKKRLADKLCAKGFPFSMVKSVLDNDFFNQENF